MARHRIRFTLLTLLGIVTFVAIGAAVMAKPTPWGARLALNLVLLTVGYSFIAAILGKGDSRAFWIGFAILSSGHLIFALILYPRFDLILTNACLDGLWEVLGRQRPNPFANDAWSDRYEDFITTGVALLTFLLGGLGGLVGLHKHRHNDVQVE